VRERNRRRRVRGTVHQSVVDLALLGVKSQVNQLAGDLCEEACNVVDVRLKRKSELRTKLAQLSVERFLAGDGDVRVRSRLGNTGETALLVNTCAREVAEERLEANRAEVRNGTSACNLCPGARRLVELRE